MKAQIAGAVPVVIPTGALKDTVMFGHKTSLGMEQLSTVQQQQECLQEWFSLLIQAMRNSEETSAIRDQMQRETREYFSWKTIATEWAAEILQEATIPETSSPMFIF